jgi:hypothetical protein
MTTNGQQHVNLLDSPPELASQADDHEAETRRRPVPWLNIALVRVT